MSLELDPSQGERDVYGRLLAYVWLPDGRNFGEAMIADGFGHEYTYDQPYAYVDVFRAVQDSAIANKAGLWSPSTCAGDTTRPADAPAVAEVPIGEWSLPRELVQCAQAQKRERTLAYVPGSTYLPRVSRGTVTPTVTARPKSVTRTVAVADAAEPSRQKQLCVLP